jgi:hypothetical protein
MKDLIAKQKRASSEASRCYSEMLHNVALYTPVYGAADCLDGLPYYCDGNHLLVIGYSFDKSMTEVGGRVARVIAKVIERFSEHIHSIEFWGPDAPTIIDVPSRFERTTCREPDQANCDVFLPLVGLSRESLRSRRDVRRALRNGLSTRINVSKELSSAHTSVVDGFLRRHPNLGGDELRYFASWQEVLRDSDSEIFEVFQEDQLTGFAVLNCFGESTATYAYGFFDNSFAGTSDLAHCAMIEYCLEAGLKEVDLGYSIHASLLRYKKKWGETRCVQPPWSMRWTSNRTSENVDNENESGERNIQEGIYDRLEQLVA